MDSWRPVCEVANFTCGDCVTIDRIFAPTSADACKEIPGGRLARIHRTPSSSCGRNSVPSFPASTKPKPTTASVPAITIRWLFSSTLSAAS